ncbi:LuxR C-terminal-related transcriptional regulator [Lachnospiraceae bacterium JLR.KK008]
MKRRWQVFLYLLLYLLLLAFVMEFDVKKLVDGKEIFMLLTGAILLTLPFCHRGIKKGELADIFGKKAVEAGLIQTFLLLFVRLSDEKGSAELLSDAALCFRPMLYAFCAKFTLEQEEAGKEKEAPPATEQEDVAGKRSKQETIAFEDCMAGGLTKREAEIALLICEGDSNGEIAEKLVISETTVKKHVSNIFEKTGIRKREELRQWIVENRNAEMG